MRNVAFGAFELVRETFRFDFEFDIEYEYDFANLVRMLWIITCHTKERDHNPSRTASQIGWFLMLIPPHIMYSNRDSGLPSL